MAKRGTVLAVSSVLLLGFGLSCSGDDDGSLNERRGDGASSTGAGGSGGGGTTISNTGATAAAAAAAAAAAGPGTGTGAAEPGTEPGATVNPGEGTDITGVPGEDAPALAPGDFGVAGKAVTEADIEAIRQQSCSGWAAEPEPIGATMFWVLDASSSMRDPPPEGGTLNKWEVTKDALIRAVNDLRADTYLGMLAYPNRVISGQAGDPSNCVNIDALTPLGPLDDAHRQGMIDAINAVETNTCTPTLDAYNAAVEEFVNTPTVGDKYIMLMTDGQPTLDLNCNPGQCTNDLPGSEQPVIDAIAAAYNNYGIMTFVLGCPGSEVHSQTGRDNRWWLSQAAELGGTSPGNCSHEAEPYCHFDMTGDDINFAEELNAALQTIVGSVVSCDYAIPAPPPGEAIDMSAVILILRPSGGEPIQILRNDNPGCAPDGNGWYYDEATQRIKLCPETCKTAQSDAKARAELLFGCVTEVVLPQ
jgi:hypothetical protein